MIETKVKQRRKGNRERLMSAALDLLAEDQSGLSGISLRQITKACGLSPPAFYSHFSSVEELGLALVSDAGSALKKVLEGVREAGNEEAVVEASVQAAFEYILENEALFILISRERAGSSPALRQAIRREVRDIVDTVAAEFHGTGLFERFDLRSKRTAVGAIVALGLSLIPDFLDASRASPAEGDFLLDEFKKQLKLLLL